MEWTEILGIIASVFILSSLTFKCTDEKRNVLMRSLNNVGSLFFVIYGIFIRAWSIVVCNGLLFVFNIYHITRLCLSIRKQRLDAKAIEATPIEEDAASETTAENQ